MKNPFVFPQKQSETKTFFYIFLLFSILVFLLHAPRTLFAVDDPGVIDSEARYEPLAPLPGLEGDVTVTEYLTTLYQIGVSIVLVIAVVMFIFGGIQYMTSDSIGGKSNGRETITKALIGILLAVGSYLLLFLIGGPSAVQIGLNVEDVGFVEAPEEEEEEQMSCEITKDAVQMCIEQGGNSMVVEDHYCSDQERLSGQVCCLDAAGPTYRYISPYHNGFCSDEQLEASLPENIEPGTVDGCYTELVTPAPTTYQEQICQEWQENISIYIEGSKFQNRPRTPGSACYGLNPQQMDEVFERFESECAAAGGAGVDDVFEGNPVYYCGIPADSPESCMANIEEPEEVVFSSAFGECTGITQDYGGSHEGIDFSNAGCESYGKPVYPVYDGEVIHVGRSQRGARGYHVKLRHKLPSGETIQTHYLHMIDGSSSLAVGDLVRGGSTKIGEIGNTGLKTGVSCGAHPGTHLHITFGRDEGEGEPYYNPLDFFEDTSSMKNTLSGCSTY